MEDRALVYTLGEILSTVDKMRGERERKGEREGGGEGGHSIDCTSLFESAFS